MAKGKYWGIELYNLEKYIEHRTKCLENKCGTVTIQFTELDGMINLTKFSKRFFNKSHSWFSQRLHGALVMRKEQEFKEAEYVTIANGFRELAKQLTQYADEIDQAVMFDYEEAIQLSEKEQYLKDCTLYKGEEKCPDYIKDIPFGLSFWEIEKDYVEQKDSVNEMEKLRFFFDSKVKLSNFELPIFLYACLFTFYCHNNEADRDKLALSFEESKFFNDYLAIRKKKI